MATFPAGTQRAVLRLQAVRQEDAGHYGCEALGEAGVALDSTVLHVGCKSCWVLLSAQACSTALLSGSAPACCFPSLPGYPAGRCWCSVQTGRSLAGFPSFGKMQEAQRVAKDKEVTARGHEGLGCNWGCKVQSVGLRRGGA